MVYTIDELYNKVLSPVLGVYDVFKNFFGEEYVDLQTLSVEEFKEKFDNTKDLFGIEAPDAEHYDCSDESLTNITYDYGTLPSQILVWWPEVTITNEHNKSVKIQDLYAKIPINIEGKIPLEMSGVTMTRTTYNALQFSSGYMHSHLMGFSPERESSYARFSEPCLGRGPIRNTIIDLKATNEEALWMLFCQELAQYVTVESLTGGPYRKLEFIGFDRRGKVPCEYQTRTPKEILEILGRGRPEEISRVKEILSNFMEYYASLSPLPVSYIQGKYICTWSFYDYLVNVSNAFIDWINQHGNMDDVDILTRTSCIKTVECGEGGFYETGGIIGRQGIVEGVEILKFKGESKRLHVLADDEADTSCATILNPGIANFIINRIFNIINYHYGHTEDSDSRETTTETSKKVYYL